jgi:hypothetical protein
LLVFNVSNRYLDLAPLVRGLADEAGQQTVRILSSGDVSLDTRDARYVIATNNRRFLDDQRVRVAAAPYSADEPDPLVWTDDSASLWSVITPGLVASRWDSAPNRGHFVLDRGNFISTADETRIGTLSRALYSDTRGAGAIIVVTAELIRDEGLDEASFDKFMEILYGKQGLSRPGLERGLLLFISRMDRRAAIHVGENWPPGQRERIDLIFRRTVIAGLSQGQASRGILEFVEAFDEFVRERASSS